MDNITKFLVDAADSGNQDMMAEAINTAIEYYLRRIADAVNPVTSITTPIVAATLKAYLSGIIKCSSKDEMEAFLSLCRISEKYITVQPEEQLC